MTRDESLQITEMVLSHWRVKNWEKEEIDAFARGIQDLDASVATSTVITSSKELNYAPRISEFRERYRTEKRRLAPELPPPAPAAGQPLDFWVKRWICARMLFKFFGKEKDYRRFAEQGDYGDLTQELMPEGAWVEEANSMDDEEVMKRWRAHMRA